MYCDGSHTILYLTNESSTKCKILYDGKVQYTNDQRCDKISCKSCNITTNSLRQAFLYLTNKSSAKCQNWYDGKVLYANDQRCDKISVNNVNLVIQQQIASGKHYCISLTKAPVNVKIVIMVKLNTPKINIVIKCL